MKKSSIAAIVAVATLGLASCGGGSDTTSSTAEKGSTGTTSAGATGSTGDVAKTTGGSSGETTTVRMVLWPGPEGDAMQKVVDEYNAGQGASDGVEVEMILLSRDDTFAREATEIASNSDAVDLYFTASYNVGQFANGLAPIDDVKIDKDMYFPVALESLQVGGQQMALPLDVSNHFLYYRSDLIDALMSDPAQQETYKTVSADVLGEAREPKTPDQWDVSDFLAMSAYFSKSANPDSPTEYGTHLQAGNSPFNTLLWDDILWGLGGSWTSADGKTAALDSPEAQEAANVYRQIYERGWTAANASQSEYAETNAAFQSGDVAFIIQWSAAFATLDDPEQSPNTAGKVGIAPPPGQKTHVHALGVSLNKNAQHPDEAKTWLTYLGSQAGMEAYAKAGGIPSVPSILEANADINPIFPQIGADVEQYGYSPFIFNQTFATMEDLGTTLSGVWTGVDETDPALKGANERLQKRLDEQ